MANVVASIVVVCSAFPMPAAKSPPTAPIRGAQFCVVATLVVGNSVVKDTFVDNDNVDDSDCAAPDVAGTLVVIVLPCSMQQWTKSALVHLLPAQRPSPEADIQPSGQPQVLHDARGSAVVGTPPCAGGTLVLPEGELTSGSETWGALPCELKGRPESVAAPKWHTIGTKRANR